MEAAKMMQKFLWPPVTFVDPREGGRCYRSKLCGNRERICSRSGVVEVDGEAPEKRCWRNNKVEKATPEIEERGVREACRRGEPKGRGATSSSRSAGDVAGLLSDDAFRLLLRVSKDPVLWTIDPNTTIITYFTIITSIIRLALVWLLHI